LVCLAGLNEPSGRRGGKETDRPNAQIRALLVLYETKQHRKLIPLSDERIIERKMVAVLAA